MITESMMTITCRCGYEPIQGREESVPESNNEA